MQKTDTTTAAPSPRKRVELHKGADGVAVWFDPATNPGVKSFGDLLPGTEYVVTPAEATRLVTVKRFDYVTPADRRRADAAAAERARAADAPATTPGADVPAAQTPAAPAASPAATTAPKE